MVTRRPIPRGRDFEFRPHELDIKTTQSALGIYRHIVDAETAFMRVRNDGDEPLILSADMRFGSIAEAQIEGTFHVSSEDHGLLTPTPYPDCLDPAKETKLANGITICGNHNAANALATVTEA